MEEESLLRVGIITVSDSCSAGEAVDESGKNLKKLIGDGLISNAVVARQSIVPDDIPEIQKFLRSYADDDKLDIILTTGGTGLSFKDVTPDATVPLLDRTIPGITFSMINCGLAKTPYAALSRGVAGVRGNSLIVNLPGSKKGAQESLEAIATTLPHAISLIQNQLYHVKRTHKELHGSQCPHQKSKAEHPTLSKVDISHVAHRLRHSKYPMISVAEAQLTVLKNTTNLTTETVSYQAALGKVLAQDVIACDPLPPFPASIKDGYAVIAADGKGRRNVIGAVTAGQPSPRQLVNGSCVRVNTGAPVPPNADAVVQVEDTVLLKSTDDGRTELEIEIMKAPSEGLDIRPIGSDINTGELVLKKNTLLTSSELGILATVGVTHVSVFRQPVVGILSTGNELQVPGEKLQEGKIRDSNKTTLLNLLKENGFESSDLGIVTDDPTSLVNALHKALSVCDVVITTGSVSMGEKDILKDILSTDFGATIHFGRVNMKPGKPTTFFTLEYNEKRKLVFGLPGNPVSATVTSHLFVLPSLRKSVGISNPLATVIKAKVVQDFSLDERPEYHRAVLNWNSADTVPEAQSTGRQISSRLLSCVSANCLLALPPRSEDRPILPSGSIIDTLIISRI